MKKKNNKANNKKKLLLVSIIGVVLIAVIGITYAWLTQVLSGTKVNRITAGTLDLVLDDTTSDGIDLQYAVPQTDSQGLNNTPYTFKVINRGSMNAKYNVYLEDEEIEGTRLDDSDIKFNLVRDNNENNPRLLSETIVNDKKLIEENTIIDADTTYNYTLKLWINSEAVKEDVANKKYQAKIRIEAIQTEESNTWTVSYNSNGGTGTMENSINRVVANTYTAPADKKFKEWNTKADGSGITYTTSSKVLSNLTLYAIWYTPTYVYATYGDGHLYNDEWVITNVSEGKPTRPTNYNTYLKYETLNGGLGNTPEVCTYINTYGGEFCIKRYEQEVSINKMKTYFGWNDSTNSSTYQGVTCTTYSNGVICSDSKVKVSVVSNGVSIKDIANNVYCAGNGSGNYCDS